MIPEFVSNPRPDLYRTGKYLVVDFETTSLNNGSALNKENRMVLAVWKIYDGDFLVKQGYKFGGIYEQKELIDDLQTVDFLVAHNAKFELQWLDRCGYDIGSRPVYDTMVAEWVIASNRGWRLNLDAVARRHGVGGKAQLVKRLIHGGVSPDDIPKSLLLSYCAQDVDITREIFLKQLEIVEGTRLLPIIYTRCLTTIALADIEKNGVQLDAALVEEEYERAVREYAELEQELHRITGGINPNSPKQLGEFIYGTLGFEELCNPYTGEPLRTAKGARKTDTRTLIQLRATTPEQQRFLDLKHQQGKLRAALTKNLDFFVGVCREKNGLFYGELNQGRTKTGRLASSGRPLKLKLFDKPKACQFQNLPNQYKQLITVRNPGWLICEADGKQLEFRVGGHLGRDEQIYNDIVNKADIHSETARALTQAGEPTTRRAAKASTFRPMYGGTKGSPAIEAYCKFFAEKYHQLNSTQRNWALEAAAKHEIESEWGMKYYFPDVKVLKSGYISGQQQVFNYPIQAFATAEIIPIALVFFWFRTRNARLFVINTVHDSIICEVPKDEIELFQKAMVQSLTYDVYKYLKDCYNVTFTVPLGVSMKFGTHWSKSSFTDDELEQMTLPLKTAGFEVEVDDGEVSVDVDNPLLQEVNK